MRYKRSMLYEQHVMQIKQVVHMQHAEHMGHDVQRKLFCTYHFVQIILFCKYCMQCKGVWKERECQARSWREFHPRNNSYCSLNPPPLPLPLPPSPTTPPRPSLPSQQNLPAFLGTTETLIPSSRTVCFRIFIIFATRIFRILPIQTCIQDGVHLRSEYTGYLKSSSLTCNIQSISHLRQVCSGYCNLRHIYFGYSDISDSISKFRDSFGII